MINLSILNKLSQAKSNILFLIQVDFAVYFFLIKKTMHLKFHLKTRLNIQDADC